MPEPIQTKIDGQTFYQILGLEEKATEQEIKTSYRKLALKYHPDKVGADGAKEAGEIFIKVKTAYETLSDAGKKMAYDKELEFERNPRQKRASTVGGASNNATYGSTSSASRYTSYTNGGRRNYHMSAEDDILEDLLNEQRAFTRTFNFGFDPSERPAGARVRRTSDGVSVEWSWSFGTGGARTGGARVSARTGGESRGAQYSPPPPPIHPSRREAIKTETEAEKKKRLEAEARKKAEEDELRGKRAQRMADLRRAREREREEARIKEEADRYAERAREEYIRNFQSTSREKVAYAAEERLRQSNRERTTGRVSETKPIRKNQARVEEEYDSAERVRRSTRDSRSSRKEAELVEDRRGARHSTSDMPRRVPAPELKRHDSNRSSATARRGEPIRRTEVPPLPPRELKKRDKIAAWAAELVPEEDHRRSRYSRPPSPSPSSDLVHHRKSRDHGYTSSRRPHSVINTSSESSLERRRPSGARSPSRHHRSSRRYKTYSDSDSYDSGSDDSTRYPRAVPPASRDDDRYKSRHGHHRESRSGHGHSHSHRKEVETKKGGLGSLLGKVAKSIMGDGGESDSDYSEYSSVSSGRRKSRRREDMKGRERGKERVSSRY